MPLYQVIVLGVVQGLTEFLPISSTAHLWLIPWLFHWNDPGLTFDVALHVGTLLAVLIYFFRTWVDLLLLGCGIKKQIAGVAYRPALFWFLVLATIPAGLVGWFFQEQAETTWRQPNVIAGSFILVALLMAWAEKVGHGKKDVSQVSLADSLWIGVAQALAPIPGVSRSGITMTAALFRNMNRSAAARFSFLLSTPIIAGAALKASMDLYHGGIAPGMAMPFLVGVLVSGIVGYATISFFLKFLQFGTFKIFIYYRIILGIIVLALAFFLGPGAA